MRKTERKKVLIDLSYLKHPNCGFGQIAINYSKLFAALSVEDLHFIYLLPKGYQDFYGNNVTCVPIKHRRINRWLPFTLPKVDLWHSVNQFNKLYRKSPQFILTIHDLNFLFEHQGRKKQIFLKKIQQKIDKATIITTISQTVIRG
ncbi:hypothetical protein [Phocaeicola faecalis]